MRVALFGGSFDPPHIGHQMAMLYVLATARVDRLLMVPCFRHPFDKRLTPFAHRLEMARRAAEVFSDRVEISDIERRIGGESRTLHTVRALLAERPGSEIVVVIGSDLVAERERWYGYDELAELVDFAVVGRAGYGGPVEIPDVSSTEIRARLERRESVEGLLPTVVTEYIAAHELYREAR